MKSICLIAESNRLRPVERDVPEPKPGPGEVLIQVCAAGVTPTELLWYPTLHTKSGEVRSRPVPGHEFSGIVASVGKDVAGVAAGAEVYGLNDWFEDGATAEFCITVPSSIAPKPARLSHIEAAAVPIGALTAWQGLFDRAKLRAGERVLIQGGAGGVGVFAVQLAHLHGAHVATTAAPRNFDFVRQLGADEIIDYHTDYFAERTGTFDVVFDVIGGETLRKSWPLLKAGGRMIAIAEESAQATEERVKQAFVLVEPNRQQLIEIGAMLDSGRLRAVVDSVVPFEQAPDAYLQKLPAKRGQGKIVVEVLKRRG